MSDNAPTTTSTGEQKHAKEIRIVVNATPKVIETDIVSYEQVVHLAYPMPPSTDTLFSVTFRNAIEPKQGSLAPGQTVEVKQEGTIFNVKATGKS